MKDKAMPEPPAWLEADARKIWRRKLKEMDGTIRIEEIDLELLARYCYAVARADEIRARQQRTPEAQAKVDERDWLRYARLMLKLSDPLGFNPMARATIIARRSKANAKKRGR